MARFIQALGNATDEPGFTWVLMRPETFGECLKMAWRMWTDPGRYSIILKVRDESLPSLREIAP